MLSTRQHTLFRLTQPVGFACFLVYFLLPRLQGGIYIFLAGLALTLVGIAYETWFGLKYRSRSKEFDLFAFLGSVMLKLALIGIIAWRVLLEGKWSIFALIIIVFIALGWNTWLFVFKRKRRSDESSDLLDSN